jgi:NADH dehydrogenase FAD-containing subunit
VLVGAGHTHLHLIDRAELLRQAGFDVTLIAPRLFRYSGLATAVAAGAVPAAEATIDVAALAARRGVRHLEGRVTGCEPARRTVALERGGDVSYDVVSFNVGSAVAAGTRSTDEVSAVKPFERLFGLAAWLSSTRPGRSYRLSMVGGGPTGLELAGQISARHADRVRVTVFERRIPGADLPDGARRRVVRLLERRGVQLRGGVTVDAVGQQGLVVDGEALDHDHAVIATGLTPTTVASPDLRGDARGIPVRATLQHVDHADIYAAGDAAHFVPQPLPKLGVHAVRQGPVLERSLLARQAGRALPLYVPQRHALRILDLGGTALAARGRWWAEGPTLRQLKRVIDRRWLARYR